MGGHWVAYEKPHYMGYQYILGRGEYPNFHHWMASTVYQILSDVLPSKSIKLMGFISRS